MKKVFLLITFLFVIVPVAVFAQYNDSTSPDYIGPRRFPHQRLPTQQLPTIVRPQAPIIRPSEKSFTPSPQKPVAIKKPKDPPLNLGVIERDDSFWKTIRKALTFLEQPLPVIYKPPVIQESDSHLDDIFAPYVPAISIQPNSFDGFIDLIKISPLKNPFINLSPFERAFEHRDIKSKLDVLENILEENETKLAVLRLQKKAVAGLRGEGETQRTLVLQALRNLYDQDITHYEHIVADQANTKKTLQIRLKLLEELDKKHDPFVIPENKVTANPEKLISVPVSVNNKRDDLLKRLEALREKFRGNPAALKQLDSAIKEAQK